MKKDFSVAVSMMLLFAMATTAMAEERTCWQGHEDGNKRVLWTVTHSGGDTWVLKINGRDFGTFETIASKDEYIELQMKGIREFSGIRLYKDRLEMNKDGSKFRWETCANGGWEG